MRIVLLGDIALHGLFDTEAENNLERITPLIELLDKDDFVFGNLEAPVRIENNQNVYKRQKKEIILGVKQEVLLRSLKQLKVNCVSLANNHILDYGLDGLKETINTLKILNIKYTGAGFTKSEISPALIDINGYKIAFLAYVDKSTNPKFEIDHEILVNYFDEKKIELELKELRPKVDYIILSIHWGNDYSYYYTKEQQKTALKLINAGANIIMGHHPHSIQPYERVGNNFVFYSLGGLIFGDYEISNRLRSLPLKAKWGFIPIINTQTSEIIVVFFNVLKFNFLKNSQKLKLRYKKISIQNKLILKGKIFLKVYYLKEHFWDRINNFFFGYYRTPLKDIFKLQNIKRYLYFLKRDFK